MAAPSLFPSEARKPEEARTTMAASAFYSMAGDGKVKWAAARAGEGFDDLGLWGLVEGLTERGQWQELHLYLGDGELSDLPPTDVLGRVCSPRLAGVIDTFSPEVLWLPVVLHRGEERFRYSFMHCRPRPDVVDPERSTIARGVVVNPHVSLARAAGLPVFCIRPLETAVKVRSDVKAAIQQARCLGIDFQPLACS